MSTDKANSGQGKKTYKRSLKNIILTPGFQWKHTAAVVAAVFMVSFIVSVQAFGLLYEQARTRLLYSQTMTVDDVNLSLVLSSLSIALVPALVFGIWTIFATHRVCGPLFVMRRHLNDLADGRQPRRRPLRKKDQFIDFHEDLWKAIDTVTAQRRAYLTAMNEIRDTATAAVSGDDKKRKDAIQAIQSKSAEWCSGLPTVSPDNETSESQPSSKTTSAATPDRELVEMNS